MMIVVDPNESTGDRLLHTAVRRKNVYLVLSMTGVAVGLGLALWFALGSHEGPASLRFVVVLLILLNARSNLRQYRLAAALQRRLG